MEKLKRNKDHKRNKFSRVFVPFVTDFTIVIKCYEKQIFENLDFGIKKFHRHKRNKIRFGYFVPFCIFLLNVFKCLRISSQKEQNHKSGFVPFFDFCLDSVWDHKRNTPFI